VVRNGGGDGRWAGDGPRGPAVELEGGGDG